MYTLTHNIKWNLKGLFCIVKSINIHFLFPKLSTYQVSTEGLKDLEMWGPRILVFSIIYQSLLSSYYTDCYCIYPVGFVSMLWHIALEVIPTDTILKYYSKGEKQSQAESPHPPHRGSCHPKSYYWLPQSSYNLTSRTTPLRCSKVWPEPNDSD